MKTLLGFLHIFIEPEFWKGLLEEVILNRSAED
jgi:hypothetical protein